MELSELMLRILQKYEESSGKISTDSDLSRHLNESIEIIRSELIKLGKLEFADVRSTNYGLYYISGELLPYGKGALKNPGMYLKKDNDTSVKNVIINPGGIVNTGSGDVSGSVDFNSSGKNEGSVFWKDVIKGSLQRLIPTLILAILAVLLVTLGVNIEYLSNFF